MIKPDEIEDWLESDSTNGLIHGDSKEVLKQFPDESVNCVIGRLISGCETPYNTSSGQFVLI